MYILYLQDKKEEDDEDNIEGMTSKIEYQGHSYIVWSINMGGGIVHDPDCKCLTPKKD